MSLTSEPTTNPNDELARRLQAGDLQARDELILRNVGLVKAKVRATIAMTPPARRLRDDLQAAGMLGLTVAAAKIAEGAPLDNVTALLSVHVTNEMGRTLQSEIGSSDESARRRKVKRNRKHQSAIEGDDEPTYSTVSTTILRDLLSAACESREDRTIVRLREAGHSDQYIADELGWTNSRVYQARKAIELRFDELNH